MIVTTSQRTTERLHNIIINAVGQMEESPELRKVFQCTEEDVEELENLAIELNDNESMKIIKA